MAENSQGQADAAMEAIVLAGGMGTRLRPVVADIPKPMAPVSGRPFLTYILGKLQSHGVQRVVLATGYRHEAVADYFGASYGALALSYAVETVPLGTGGGIRKGLELCSAQNVVVLNGDTFFAVDLAAMLAFHLRSRADITVALKEMVAFDRYGAVLLEGERIVAFHEKKQCAKGFINGGVYIVRNDLFAGFELPERFSFEVDFLGKFLHSLNVIGFKSAGYFIDIGIPADYERAGRECARLLP